MTELSLALPPNVRMLVVPGGGTVLLADLKQREPEYTDTNPRSHFFHQDQLENSHSIPGSPNKGCLGLSLGSVPETTIPGDLYTSGYDARVYDMSTRCLEESHFPDDEMGTNSAFGPRTQQAYTGRVASRAFPGLPGENPHGLVGCGPRCCCPCLRCCDSRRIEPECAFGNSYHCQCRPWDQEYLQCSSNQRRDTQLGYFSQNASNGDARRLNNNHGMSSASWIPDFIINAPKQQGYSSQTGSITSDRVSGNIIVESELTFDPRDSFRFEYKFRNKFVLRPIETIGADEDAPSQRSTEGTPTSTGGSSHDMIRHQVQKPYESPFSNNSPPFSSDDIVNLLKDELSPMLSNNFYMPLSQIFQPPQPETYLGAYEGRNGRDSSGFDRIAAQLSETHANIHASALDHDISRPQQQFPESGNLECLGLYMSANFGPFLDLALQFDPNHQRDPAEGQAEEDSGAESSSDRRPYSGLEQSEVVAYHQPTTGFTDSVDIGPHPSGSESAPALSRFFETLAGMESFIFTNEFYEEYLANQLDEDDYEDSYSDEYQEGLSEQALNALPVVPYHPSPSEKPEDGDHCTICLVPLEQQEEVKMLGCRHFFHPRCIDIWLGKANCCPLCKQQVTAPIR